MPLLFNGFLLGNAIRSSEDAARPWRIRDMRRCSRRNLCLPDTLLSTYRLSVLQISLVSTELVRAERLEVEQFEKDPSPNLIELNFLILPQVEMKRTQEGPIGSVP